MPRRVIENQLVRPIDLPINASFSYLKNCHITGNYAGYKLRYVDVVGGTVDADFRRANVKGIASYGDADWRGVKLRPRQTRECSHDITLAVLIPLMQAKLGSRPELTKTQKTILINPDSYKAGSGYPMTGKWDEIAAYWAIRLGITDEKAREIILDFVGVHDVKTDIEQGFNNPSSPEQRLQVYRDDRTSDNILPADWSAKMKAEARKRDRWALSRAAEPFLATRYGVPLTQVRVGCLSIFPWIQFKAWVGEALPIERWPYK